MFSSFAVHYGICNCVKSAFVISWFISDLHLISDLPRSAATRLISTERSADAVPSVSRQAPVDIPASRRRRLHGDGLIDMCRVSPQVLLDLAVRVGVGPGGNHPRCPENLGTRGWGWDEGPLLFLSLPDAT